MTPHVHRPVPLWREALDAARVYVLAILLAVLAMWILLILAMAAGQ